MSEIFSEQLTAVANLVLAAFAIMTAILALLAWLKQSREVRDQAEMLDLQRQQLEAQREDSARQAEVLELQAADLRESLEERKRSAARRRREQAAHVFITEKPHPWNNGTINGGHHSIAVTVANTSDEPIYQARLRWHLDGQPHRDPTAEEVGTILPGDKTVKSGSYPRGTDLGICGAILEFRDAAGVKWLRRADGYLGEEL